MNKVRRKHKLRVPHRQKKVARLTDAPPPREQASVHPHTHKILQLQQHLGNRAVQRLLENQAIQRQVLGQITDALGTIDADTGNPDLGIGSQGPDVVRLQRRLNFHGARLVKMASTVQ